ncbi:MAG: hypothetical protein GF346_12695 [Candidatus Eisenbacteria bacterium]|nr:hypothetical protein [Candidatus Latescibacterota bacterium]MBD3303295.1 hypothetical protein [Candidatus Eisenbacteria bacterium]
MQFLRLTIPLLLTAVAGLIPIIAFMWSTETRWIHATKDRLEVYMVIIAAFALLLGVVNVIQSNVKKIERRQKGWQYGAFLLAGLISMGAVGILSAARIGPFQGIGFLDDGTRTPFQYMAEYIFNPLQAAMFALLAFFMASAAFRAFRARNFEATILLVAAGIVMIGRIPLGETLLGGSPLLGEFTEWLMTWPNGAAQRGIMIGAALGAASLSLRVIVGIERSFLGIERNE